MYDFKGFYNENRDYIIPFVIVSIICLAGVWLVCDHYRNEGIHHNTDVILDNIEKRIDDAGKRVDTVKDGVGRVEDSVQQSAREIAEGRKSAEAIATGIAKCEERVDHIIQGHGRIKNIIAEVEAINRQGTQGSQTAGVAK